MKTILRSTSYMYLVLLICFACNYSTPQNTPESNTIIGKWEWVESSGGIAGVTTTPVSSGDTKTIVFTSDGNYEEYKNGQNVKTTTYEIVEDKSIFSGDSVSMIKYDGASLQKQSYNLKDTDSLSLKDECYDCYSHIFIRKK